MRDVAPGRQEVDEREGGRALRKRAAEPGAYSETRVYKQRATQEEVTRRRLRPRRRRLGSTATSTELGKRLRDEMREVAERCQRQRRERFGDG